MHWSSIDSNIFLRQKRRFSSNSVPSKFLSYFAINIFCKPIHFIYHTLKGLRFSIGVTSLVRHVCVLPKNVSAVIKNRILKISVTHTRSVQGFLVKKASKKICKSWHRAHVRHKVACRRKTVPDIGVFDGRVMLDFVNKAAIQHLQILQLLLQLCTRVSMIKVQRLVYIRYWLILFVPKKARC